MRCFCRGTPRQNFMVRLFLMGKSRARENMVMELANHGSTNRLAMSVRIWSHYRDVLKPLAPTKSSCSCLQRVFTSPFPSNSSDSSPFSFHTVLEVFTNQKSVMRIILLNEEKLRLRFTPCLKNILDLLAIGFHSGLLAVTWTLSLHSSRFRPYSRRKDRTSEWTNGRANESAWGNRKKRKNKLKTPATHDKITTVLHKLR